MLRKIVIFGLVAGVVVGIPLFIMALSMQGQPPAPYRVALGYLIMLVALSAVFVAVKRHRDVDLGGVIRFWPAFGLGLGISAVAGVVYVLAWEAALAFTGMDFIAEYSRMALEEQRAKGASAETLAKMSAEMQQLAVQYAKPWFRLSISFAEIFPVGVLVSLISAGLLRNPRFLPARAANASDSAGLSA